VREWVAGRDKRDDAENFKKNSSLLAAGGVLPAAEAEPWRPPLRAGFCAASALRRRNSEGAARVRPAAREVETLEALSWHTHRRQRNVRANPRTPPQNTSSSLARATSS
jgi:hypothetical protein